MDRKKDFFVSFYNVIHTAVKDLCCKQPDFHMKRTRRDLQTVSYSRRLRIDQ